MSEHRSLHVIFCDDIRQEVQGKYTLVGCYGPDLIADRLPAVLPRLCIRAEAMTPVTRPFERLKLRVLLKDEALVDIDTPPEQLAAIEAAAEAETRQFGFAWMIVLSPFSIQEPGKLRVEIETESETVRGPALRLVVRPTPSDLSGGAKVATMSRVQGREREASAVPKKKPLSSRPRRAKA